MRYILTITLALLTLASPLVGAEVKNIVGNWESYEDHREGIDYRFLDIDEEGNGRLRVSLFQNEEREFKFEQEDIISRNGYLQVNFEPFIRKNEKTWWILLLAPDIGYRKIDSIFILQGINDGQLHNFLSIPMRFHRARNESKGTTQSDANL